MHDTDVFDTVISLLADEGRGVDAVAVGAQTSLGGDGLHLSSLELVRLLVNLEERFDIELDDVTIMNSRFDSVADLVHLVGRSLEMSGRELISATGDTERA